MKKPATFSGWLVFFALSGCASSPLIPSDIPTNRSALRELTSGLRSRTAALDLNGRLSSRNELVSRALVLLPKDRAKPGVVSFELEDGPRAGVYQCEALGRGRTSPAPHPGWVRSAIDAATIYYAPMNASDGATPVGIYDVRNISTQTYELAFLNKDDDLKDEAALIAATKGAGAAEKPFFSAIWKTWYPKSRRVMPIDMLWAEDYQKASQGARFPLFERPSSTADAFRDRQLSRNKRYYYGPFGRSGLANHTDRWDDPDRKTDPRFSNDPELADFRWRDTDGCLKVRPDCLELLNEWVTEQTGKGRRTQYEIRESRRLDGVPNR